MLPGKSIIFKCILLLLVLESFAAVSRASDMPLPEMLRTEQQTIIEQNKESSDLELLKAHIAALEQAPRLSSQDLASRSRKAHLLIAAQVRLQRSTMADFSSFVSWLSGNLEGYHKYLQASTVAANIVKILPIPYAGQASLFTKFVTQAVVSLNTASSSINRYLITSQNYLSRHDAIEKSGHPSPEEIASLSLLAQDQLLRDTSELQRQLASTGEIATSVLSFLEVVNSYLKNADQYWAKTKSFVSRNDQVAKENGYLAGSIAGLHDRAALFAGKMKTFKDLGVNNEKAVHTARVYDDLAKELSPLKVRDAGGR